VIQAEIIQGRPFQAHHLQEIRQLLAAHPDWSRRRLSQELARSWDWRNGVGQLKDMAARTLLLKLETRGAIVLPPRRQQPSNRMRQKRLPEQPLLEPSEAAPRCLAEVLPLVITEVSSPTRIDQRVLFESLLHHCHYLGHRSTVGENLQYLVCDRHGRPLACLLFGAPAWQCADRDRYIGWDSARRAQNLHFLANNTRFLMLGRVPGLASSVLSHLGRRLSRDWQAKYGHPIYLLETFVERQRFTAACYRAANWQRVGQTKGRTRQDRPEGGWQKVSIKDAYLYALHPQFRQRLQGDASQPSTAIHEHADPNHSPSPPSSSSAEPETTEPTTD
jgi:hypothetical protein